MGESIGVVARQIELVVQPESDRYLGVCVWLPMVCRHMKAKISLQESSEIENRMRSMTGDGTATIVWMFSRNQSKR